eukprot:1555112-Pyramimonas_sp.AAC.1
MTPICPRQLDNMLLSPWSTCRGVDHGDNTGVPIHTEPTTTCWVWGCGVLGVARQNLQARKSWRICCIPMTASSPVSTTHAGDINPYTC